VKAEIPSSNMHASADSLSLLGNEFINNNFKTLNNHEATLNQMLSNPTLKKDN